MFVWSLLKADHLQDAAKTLVRPKKPQPGRLGKAVQVFSNHFPVKCSINEISHYDVDIKGKGRPERESTRKPVGEKPLPTELLRSGLHTSTCHFTLAQEHGRQLSPKPHSVDL